MITINKVKWDGKKVEIHSVEKVKDVEKESVSRSVQRPSPKFQKVFAEAVEHAIDILELDHSYASHYTFAVTGFSFNEEEEDGRSGVVMTCQKKLKMTNAPAVMNTPHLREPMKDEEYGLPGFFDPSSLGKLIARAKEVAKDFLGGEREQLDALEETKKAEKKKDPQFTLVDGGGKKERGRPREKS